MRFSCSRTRGGLAGLLRQLYRRVVTDVDRPRPPVVTATGTRRRSPQRRSPDRHASPPARARGSPPAPSASSSSTKAMVRPTSLATCASLLPSTRPATSQAVADRARARLVDGACDRGELALRLLREQLALRRTRWRRTPRPLPAGRRSLPPGARAGAPIRRPRPPSPPALRSGAASARAPARPASAASTAASQHYHGWVAALASFETDIHYQLEQYRVAGRPSNRALCARRRLHSR